MQKPSIGKRIRRIVRKHFGPKQQGLKPAFKDTRFFHSQVRVGKRGPKSPVFPNGKPKAIVVTKFRTVKKGAHKDFEKRGARAEEYKTLLGRVLRNIHIDELPQVINLLKGELIPIGIRPQVKKDYREFSPELKEIYDEIGSRLIGLQYACKSRNPSLEEFIATVKEFREMWKKNKAKAYLTFGMRFLKNYRFGERPIQLLRSK